MLANGVSSRERSFSSERRTFLSRANDAKNVDSGVPVLESNLRDRVLSEVEKNIFIALPGKGDSNAPHALKNCVPTLEDFYSKELYSNGPRVGLLIRIRVCVKPHRLKPL